MTGTKATLETIFISLKTKKTTLNDKITELKSQNTTAESELEDIKNSITSTETSNSDCQKSNSNASYGMASYRKKCKRNYISTNSNKTQRDPTTCIDLKTLSYINDDSYTLIGIKLIGIFIFFIISKMRYNENNFDL